MHFVASWFLDLFGCCRFYVFVGFMVLCVSWFSRFLGVIGFLGSLVDRFYLTRHGRFKVLKVSCCSAVHCVDMPESDEEPVVSTDAVTEPSADIRVSLHEEIDVENAIVVKEKNTRKRDPEKLKDNLHSGILDGQEKRRRRKR